MSDTTAQEALFSFVTAYPCREIPFEPPITPPGALVRINTIAQLMARTRGEIAALVFERRGLDAEIKVLIAQLGEEGR